jgi:hypothetical protein
MKCIQKIYIKLLGIFKKNTSIRTNSLPINSEKYIASLEFSLTDQEYLDIRCKIPETKDKSIEDITVLAEKYANLLVRINDGSFKI